MKEEKKIVKNKLLLINKKLSSNLNTRNQKIRRRKLYIPIAKYKSEYEVTESCPMKKKKNAKKKSINQLNVFVNQHI